MIPLTTAFQATLANIHQVLGLNILFWAAFTIVSALLLRKDIRMDEVRMLAPSSWIAALFGAFFLALLPPKPLLIVIILFVGYFIFHHQGYKLKAPWFAKYLGASTVGAISGFLQGGGGRGSDIRTAYLLAHNYTLAETAAISSVVGIGNSMLGIIIFLVTGRLDLYSIGNIEIAVLVVLFAITLATIRAKLFHNSHVIARENLITTVILLLIFCGLLWQLTTL